MMSIINKLLKPVSREVTESACVELHDLITYAEKLPAQVKIEENKLFDVKSYFTSKGFDVELNVQNPCIGPVENLAFLIAVNYHSCRHFLKYIRDNVGRKCFHLNYSVHKYSAEDKEAIVMLAGKFGDYGIISNVFFNKKTDMISGCISSAPRVINFINGDYLEFFGRAVAERVVKEAAQKYNADSEIYSNVKISKDMEKHELDMVFRIGENIFWSEIKSGKFSDFDNYRKLGVLMGVNPDRHILLTAEKDAETAEVISWFYQFYVANIDSFKDKLNEMIDKAFNEEVE